MSCRPAGSLCRGRRAISCTTRASAMPILAASGPHDERKQAVTPPSDTNAGPTAPEPPDVIDAVLGIAAGSPLAELRRHRPDFVRYTQGSHDVLLEPADPAGVSLLERAL